MTDKAATPAKKRVRTTKPEAQRRSPNHGEIQERAYYISLQDGGSDDLANWIRAERELTSD
jgi:hypothetical protein